MKKNDECLLNIGWKIIFVVSFSCVAPSLCVCEVESMGSPNLLIYLIFFHATAKTYNIANVVAFSCRTVCLSKKLL